MLNRNKHKKNKITENVIFKIGLGSKPFGPNCRFSQNKNVMGQGDDFAMAG